jgi:tetratricopeptide (TPR) repeat protein
MPARQAARQIIESCLPGDARADLAQRYLNPVTPRKDMQEQERDRSIRKKSAIRSIADTRANLRINPRNPVRWVDLALDYQTLGQVDQADRALGIALELDHSNRFVVRAAAAHYAHRDAFDEAQRVVDSSEFAKHDPSLLATSIAIGDLRKSSSRNIRAGRDSLTRGAGSSSALSELAGALAMIEWKNGSDRRARQLLRRAMTNPNENVLAQVEWAKDQGFPIGDLETGLIQPRSFEACARREATSLDWNGAIDNAELWLADQPFSIAAASHGSWAASEATQYETAADLANAGLEANHGNAMLLNNLAFALVQQGRIGEAQKAALQGLDAKPAPSDVPYLIATTGLILFRAGRFELGRRLYLRAVDYLHILNDRDNIARALILLAEAEFIAGMPTAPETWSRATRAASTVETPYVRASWDRVHSALLKHAAEPRGGLWSDDPRRSQGSFVIAEASEVDALAGRTSGEATNLSD